MNPTVQIPYVEPVHKSIQVMATAEHAFEVFTSGMIRWWLTTHSVNPTKAAIDRIVMEPRPGGRWYEVGVDGNECDWGRVLVWEPSRRLVLDWQIGGNFKLNPNLHTEVEVQFIENTSGVTDITLEHRHLEQYAELAAKLQSVLAGGWGNLLHEFAAFVEKPEIV